MLFLSILVCMKGNGKFSIYRHSRGSQVPLSQQDRAILSVYCVLHSKQGVKKRCSLSWLTNGALVNEPKCGGEGGVLAVGSQPMSTAQLYTGAQITPYLTYECKCTLFVMA
jgi:hypothetical protein